VIKTGVLDGVPVGRAMIVFVINEMLEFLGESERLIQVKVAIKMMMTRIPTPSWILGGVKNDCPVSSKRISCGRCSSGLFRNTGHSG
jgi:hypothetical protein